MFTLIIFITGFFLASATTFGGQLINAFHWLEILYYGIGIFMAVVLIIMMSAVFFKNLDFSLKEKALMFLGGTYMTMIFVIVLGINIFLVYYIQDNIPIEATSFSELPQNTLYAIYAWGALFIIGLFRKKS